MPGKDYSSFLFSEVGCFWQIRLKPLYLAKSETYLMGATWNGIVRGELHNSYITTLLQLILKRTRPAGFITSSFLVAFGSLVWQRNASKTVWVYVLSFVFYGTKKPQEHLLFCFCLSFSPHRCQLCSLAPAKYGPEEEIINKAKMEKSKDLKGAMVTKTDRESYCCFFCPLFQWPSNKQCSFNKSCFPS